MTGDQTSPDGRSFFGDIGLDRLTARGIAWESVPVPETVIPADRLRGFDALLMMGGRGIAAASLAGTGLRHVARFGAGYDAIDVTACTEASVVLTNTPEAVRVPMAHSVVAFVFALAHNLVIKDRLVRDARWDERTDWHGRGLQTATVGVVGLGGIGEEVARLFTALGIDVVAYNRTPRPEAVARLGIRQLALLEAAAVSDYLVVTVAGGASTEGLIDREVIDRMRPASFLVNVSRGSVVDEGALVDALRSGQLSGAALDVFQHEPLEPDSPLLTVDSVILSPHSLCWTEEFSAAVADSAITAIIDVAEGRTPAHAVNPEALAGVDA